MPVIINGTSGDISASSLTGVTTGKILQITQGTYSTEETFNTGSYVASGLSATITPTAASSKILINTTFLVDTKAAGRQIYIAIFRSVDGGTYTNISGGSSDANIGSYSAGGRLIETCAISKLDTPSYSVGNAIVYKLYAKAPQGTDTTMNGQGVEGSLILQEVAA